MNAPSIEGLCFASDRIVADGQPVGFFYREPPVCPEDTGWRFWAAAEGMRSPVADPPRTDVRLIIARDREVTPYLSAAVGKAFRRSGEIDHESAERPFQLAPSPVDPDLCLHADFPTVSGTVALSETWEFRLPFRFNWRRDDSDQVFWRVGMTIFASEHPNLNGDSVSTRLDWLRAAMSEEATDIHQESGQLGARLSYRLTEDRTTATLYASFHFCITDAGHVQMAIYTDEPDQLPTVEAIFQSIRATR